MECRISDYSVDYTRTSTHVSVARRVRTSHQGIGAEGFSEELTGLSLVTGVVRQHL